MTQPAWPHKIIFLLTTIPFTSTPAIATENEKELILQSKQAITLLATDLKKRLSTTLKNEGPIAAVNVCKTEAPQITSDVASNSGISVERTSLKVRNSANTPDEWELATLISFQQQKAKGASIDSLEKSAYTTSNGQKYYRFMKAIPTQSLCLTCHGKNIESTLLKTISRQYPYDQATGFSEGSIRGAFTVKIEL